MPISSNSNWKKVRHYGANCKAKWRNSPLRTLNYASGPNAIRLPIPIKSPNTLRKLKLRESVYRWYSGS